jgi:hypothetical protein
MRRLFQQSRGAQDSGAGTAELTLQRGDLIRAETAHAAALGDPESLHDLLGADLAHARQGLQESGDLHLAYDVVLLALLDDLVERSTGVLESILDLGPLPASRGGLFERGCALFRGKGRKSHAYVTSDVELSDTDR